MTDFFALTCAGLLQSFSPLKPGPFLLLHSDYPYPIQQLMVKPKSQLYIFSFLIICFTQICHNTEIKTSCYFIYITTLQPCQGVKPRSHHKRHATTKRHNPIHFNGKLAISGDRSGSVRWRRMACPTTRESSESFNFMQMKSDFRERQPIGKMTELLWSSSSQLSSDGNEADPCRHHSFCQLFLCTDYIN